MTLRPFLVKTPAPPGTARSPSDMGLVVQVWVRLDDRWLCQRYWQSGLSSPVSSDFRRAAPSPIVEVTPFHGSSGWILSKVKIRLWEGVWEAGDLGECGPAARDHQCSFHQRLFLWGCSPRSGMKGMSKRGSYSSISLGMPQIRSVFAEPEYTLEHPEKEEHQLFTSKCELISIFYFLDF